MSDLPTYVLTRSFRAPRPLVWRTWTDPKLLARWYGPNVETIIHKLDVTPGGLWLNEMRMPQGSSFQRTEYLEVERNQRLVCLMSSADADWNIAADPMMPDWPRTLRTIVTLEDDGSGTRMQLTWCPEDASPAELACFGASIANMGRGWEGGMKVLEQLLSELQPV